MKQRNQLDVGIKLYVEAYNRCKDELDNFYKRNIQIIQQAHTPIMLQLPNEGLAQHEKKKKGDLYYLILNSDGNRYSICVKSDANSPCVELLNDLIYKTEFEEHINVLIAYCETILKDGSISIDSNGSYILK